MGPAEGPVKRKGRLWVGKGRGGPTEESKAVREELEKRHTHRETQKKKEAGKRAQTKGKGGGDTREEAGIEKEGGRGEAGHRSASARHPILSSASGPPSRGTAFTWAWREGQLWPEPLCRETTPSPPLGTSHLFYLAKPGWGLGQQPQRWVNERAIGVWREWTTQCDEEVGTEFASRILHQLDPLCPPNPAVGPPGSTARNQEWS